MRVLKTLGKVLMAVLALVVAGNLYLSLARTITGRPDVTVFGYNWAVVLSGSMEPAISVDDLVISRQSQEYRVGDVITFRSGGSLTTHRILGFTEEGIQTKGDANNTPDRVCVTADQIVGKVVAIFPNVGGVIRAVKSPLGMMVLILVGFGLIEIPYLFKKNPEGCEHDESEGTEE